MKRLYPPLIVIAVTSAVLRPLLRAEFTLWDDASTVWHNPAMLRFSGAGLLEAWTTADDSIYIPLTRTLWMVLATVARTPADWMGATLNPAVFHAANLIVHLVASLLMFRLLRQLRLTVTASLIGALLFAVHPMQVEAVGWVSGLKDVLAGALALASINAYIATATLVDPRAQRMWYLGCIALFVLAVLAKPTALVLPALLGCVGVLGLQRPWRSTCVQLIPLALISFATGIAAAITQPAVVTPPVAIYLRPLVASDALGFYLRQLVWPAHFGIDYGRTPAVVLASAGVWFSALLMISITAVAYHAWHRGWRMELLGLVLFVLPVFPMLGWSRFDFQYYSTVADHYAYLAMAGPAIVVASLLTRLQQHRPTQRAMTIVAGAAIVALGVRSNLQARTWRDSESVARNALSINPHSFSAEDMLGADADVRAIWLNQQARRAEALSASKAALDHYEAAIDLNPGFVRAIEDAATSSWRLRKLVDAGDSIAYERRAMQQWKHLDALVPTLPRSLWPRFVELPSRLGKLALDFGMNADAAEYYRRALDLRPDDENARAGLAIAIERLRVAASQPATTRAANP